MKMRAILFIFLIFVFLIEVYSESENEINFKITNIITQDISLGGILTLETDWLSLEKSFINEENLFNLSILSDEDKNIIPLSCFFYKMEEFYRPIKIGCKINSQLKKGKYFFKPFETKISILFYKRDEIYVYLLPFDFSQSFNINEAKELSFYSLNSYELTFSSTAEIEKLTLYLFDIMEEAQEVIIYLGDNPIKCQANGGKMKCPILGEDLPQTKRYQILDVYIQDSQGNKKINNFMFPVRARFDYIEKQLLKIKVTNLLTNTLIDNDFLVFDTSDDKLENVIYSKTGFYLNIKKDDSISNINQLSCGFHKIPGETTKILCYAEDSLEDGTYYFEEYVSEGPLDDDDDRISQNYNIVIPTFKSLSKFLYSSKFKTKENVFDGQLREKIELKFNNKDEILNITFNHDNYEGKNKYFLGNSQLEFSNIYKKEITCGIKGSNFDSSGIYYIEKMNFLEEKERDYLLPPIEVTINWDK